ncbi:MAG TPA: MaoC/PaaZ C-terminal domain-containing protein [Mycobacteriales bacterium]|jgi:acyl dehydratase|nr:MaoC/PaaZ C-terminal domain-containing protein [Mycobacteriales bacterium]
MPLSHDQVRPGDAVPELRVTPTPESLVRWAGASGDFTPIHYDHAFATGVAGLPDIVVHGPYKLALLVRMLVDWAGGEPGAVSRISVRLSTMDFVGDELVCRGQVTGTRREDGRDEVDCEVWVENSAGERTMAGTASVRVPAAAGVPA